MPSFWQKIKAQINPFDRGATFKNPIPPPPRPMPRPAPLQPPRPMVNLNQLNQAFQQRPSNLNQITKPNLPFKVAPNPLQIKPIPRPQSRTDRTIELGLNRAGIGLGQSITGLYDLATPGKGTNRYSQNFDKQARAIDAQVKKEGLNKNLYYGTQIVANVASLGIGGVGSAGAKGVVKGAGLIPKTPQTLKITNEGLQQALKILEKKGVTGKITSQAIRGGSNPAVVKGNILGTAAYAGSESGKGRQVTPQSVATNLALGTVAGAALPLAGQGIVKGTKGLVKGGESLINKIETGIAGTQKAPKNLTEQIAQESKITREKYQPSGILGKAKSYLENVKTFIEPRNQLIQIDKARAKQLGIPYKNLPATESMQAADRNLQNAGRQAKAAFLNSNTGKIISKYAKNEEDFNAYRLYIRDLELRASGNPNKIFGNKTNDEIRNEIKRLENKYAGIRQDAKIVADETQAIQQENVQLGALSPEIYAQAVAKPNGGKFEYYTPLQRDLPEDVVKQIAANKNMGNMTNARIIQEFTGSQYNPKLTFSSLEDFWKTAYEDRARARFTQLMEKNIQQGVTNKFMGRMLQSGEQFAQEQRLRSTYKELLKVGDSLKKEIKNMASTARVSKQKLATLKAKGKTADVRAQKNLKAAQNAANEKIKIAITRTKELLIKSIDPTDTDALAAVGSLNEKDLLDMLGYITKEELFYKPPSGKKVLNVAKSAAQKAKAAKELSATQKASLDRIAAQSEAHNRLVDTIKDMKLDSEAIANAKRGVRQQIAEVRLDKNTGIQKLHGFDTNGNKFTYEIHPSVAKRIIGEKANSPWKITSIIRAPINVFKTTLTGFLNPSFTVFQILWNEMLLPYYARNLKSVYSPKVVKDVFSAMNKNSSFSKALKESGVPFYDAGFMERKGDTAVDFLKSKNNKFDKLKFSASPVRIWHKLESLGGGQIDSIYRKRLGAAAYRDALKNGMSEEQAMAQFVETYQNSLPDYNNVNNIISAINRYVPYTSASIAGTRAFASAFARTPIKNTAVLAGQLGAISGATFMALSNPEGKKFYDDMQLSKRKYILDNNIIIVLPGAHKDENTGKWSGILKINIPPELRPLNSQIRESIYNNPLKVPPSVYARNAFDFFTGTIRTLNSPLVDIPYLLRTGKDSFTGQQIFDESMSSSEKRKAILDWTNRKFGMVGKVSASDNKLKTAFESMVNTVYGNKGSTAGQRYFLWEEKFMKDLKFTEQDKSNYYANIAPRRKDPNGNIILDKTYYDGRQRALAYLEDINDPKGKSSKLYELNKRIDAEQRKRGMPGDPMFDLPKDKLIVVLNIMAAPDKQGSDARALYEKNKSWLNGFYDKRSQYWDKIQTPEMKKKQGIDPLGYKEPIPSKQLNALMKQVSFLKGKEKYQFYADHPEIQQYYKDKEEYDNLKRQFLGEVQLKPYPTPSQDVQKFMDEYNALPKGEANGKSKMRSDWIKTHPDEWAQMQQQYKEQDLYKLAQEGQLAVYQGFNFSDKTLQSIARNYAVGGTGNMVNFRYRKLSGPKRVRVRKIKATPKTGVGKVKVKKIQQSENVKVPKIGKVKRIKIA